MNNNTYIQYFLKFAPTVTAAMDVLMALKCLLAFEEFTDWTLENKISRKHDTE